MLNSLKEKFSNFLFPLTLALLFTVVNYTITVDRENTRLEGLIELAEMRSDVNNDFVSELLWSRLNDFETYTSDMLITQGRIEGVIDYINNENSTYIDNLWHEGYQRGLTQVDFEREVIAENNFQRGYEKGQKDKFFVSDSPREVNGDAIKQPEFDTKSNLPENSDVIESLNNKIDELEKSQE
jgi:hypothetical protein